MYATVILSGWTGSWDNLSKIICSCVWFMLLNPFICKFFLCSIAKPSGFVLLSKDRRTEAFARNYLLLLLSYLIRVCFCVLSPFFFLHSSSLSFLLSFFFCFPSSPFFPLLSCSSSYTVLSPSIGSFSFLYASFLLPVLFSYSSFCFFSVLHMFSHLFLFSCFISLLLLRSCFYPSFFLFLFQLFFLIRFLLLSFVFFVYYYSILSFFLLLPMLFPIQRRLLASVISFFRSLFTLYVGSVNIWTGVEPTNFDWPVAFLIPIVHVLHCSLLVSAWSADKCPRWSAIIPCDQRDLGGAGEPWRHDRELRGLLQRLAVQAERPRDDRATANLVPHEWSQSEHPLSRQGLGQIVARRGGSFVHSRHCHPRRRSVFYTGFDFYYTPRKEIVRNFFRDRASCAARLRIFYQLISNFHYKLLLRFVWGFVPCQHFFSYT